MCTPYILQSLNAQNMLIDVKQIKMYYKYY